MSCILVILGDTVTLIVDKTLSETKRIRGGPEWNECCGMNAIYQDYLKEI